MKKNIKKILILLILFLFTYQIFKNSNLIIKSVIFSFNIWKENVFPSLFPFFIISDLFINYGLIEILGEIFKPFMNKVFKIKGICSFVLLLSIISGFPSSAKYIKELYTKNLINDDEATKLLMFTHFSNPLFILGTISILFLNNKEVGFLILICHYVGNFIIGIIFRNYIPSYEKNKKINIYNVLNNFNQKKSFGNILTDAISNTIKTLLMILGVITTFLIITTVIDNLITLNSFFQSILNGLIEMTQGLKYISLLEIPLKLKCTLSTMIISFGGLSVHMQIISILNGTKIKYFPFLTARLIHALISSLLVYFLFDFWIQIT